MKTKTNPAAAAAVQHAMQRSLSPYLKRRQVPATGAMRLRAEADRFMELAKGLALQCLIDPDAGDVEKTKRLALAHVIRAETFKEAAALICKPTA